MVSVGTACPPPIFSLISSLRAYAWIKIGQFADRDSYPALDDRLG